MALGHSRKHPYYFPHNLVPREPLNLGVPVLSAYTLNQSQHRKNSMSPEPMPS